MSNIFIGLKKTCLGVLGVLDRGEREKYNETGLKEGGGIKIETTVLPLRDACFLRLKYLRCNSLRTTRKCVLGPSSISNGPDKTPPKLVRLKREGPTLLVAGYPEEITTVSPIPCVLFVINI